VYRVNAPAIGFIGLGDIGLPMAKRLQRCGRHLVVYNRTARKVDQLAGEQTHPEESPSDVAAATEILITCLQGPEADRSVYLEGWGALTSTDLSGRLIVNTSTIGPEMARTLAARVRSRGGDYLDCALLGGGREAAAAGRLVLPVGGDAGALRAARPTLDLIARLVEHTGDIGTAQVVKLVNNMQVAVSAAALAEAIALAQAAGADREVLRRILPQCSSHSRSMDRYLDAMLDRTFTRRGTLRTLGKDAGLAVGLAASQGTETPMACASAGVFSQAVAAGMGGFDVPALVEVFLKERPQT
jgi:3-hydroxyisobutyrate dehydrogenase-like beta-hydroxyacid dehydrogenase